MPELTDTQREVARQWCRLHGCCFQIVHQLAAGQATDAVTGCIACCPITGQNGRKRDQVAIDELAALLHPQQ